VRVKVTALMSIEYHFRNFFYRKGSWLRRIIEAIGFYMLVNLAINACPLSRTHGFKQVLKNVGKLIDKGWSILIFPEGEVTTDGKIKKFESGIGIIAADMKVPIIPVKIEGLYNILHDGILPLGHKPRWPKIAVTFGKPVLFRNRSYNEVANELEDIIKKM
jgi:long-chain acyl-CoA synthetase